VVVKVKRLSFESVRILYADIPNKLAQKYETLVNLVAEYGGRVHGSQHSFQISPDTGSWDSIAVYFQIPYEAKEEFEKEYGQ